jgi:hypothetical protein
MASWLEKTKKILMKLSISAFFALWSFVELTESSVQLSDGSRLFVAEIGNSVFLFVLPVV